MKKYAVCILSFLIMLLCSCGADSSGIDDYTETLESEYEYLLDEYRTCENLLDEYRDKVDEYEEKLASYDEIICYYENLCDYYGYQTYEGVYTPELWCNYVNYNSDIYHNDWLCPYFENNKKYYASASPNFLEEIEGISPCEFCRETEICFLDVNKGIIHSNKWHLDLGTEDFISLDVVYRFVSEEQAIQNGFKHCDLCDFH